jgi:excisionase family DNA binding protein
MEQHVHLDALPEVLTTREGAQMLRCSKAHFCNLLRGTVPGVPRLPYLRLGRRRLVRKTTLAEWIEQVESLGTRR